MERNTSTSTIIDVTDLRRGPPLRRYHFALAATLFAAFLLYGSWLPFDFRRLPLDDAWREFVTVISAGFPPGYSRQDVAVNIVAGVPLAFLLMGTLAFRSRRLVTIAAAFVAALCLALAISFLAEFGQIWVVKRVTSLRDIACQLGGALFGASLWVLGGRWLIEQIDDLLRFQSSSSRVQALLNLYAAGFFLWSMIPFHVVTSFRDLAQKLMNREVELIPFSFAYGSTTAMLNAVFQDILIYIPVGIWATVACRRIGRRVWIAASAFVLSTAFATSIEAAQLFVIGRFTSITDILMGSIGAALGIAATLAFGLKFDNKSSVSGHQSQGSNAGLWGVATLIYAFLLLYILGATSGWVTDPAILREKLKTFADAPFQRAQAGSSDLQTVFNIIRNVGWFAPLGILFGLTIRSLHVRRNLRIASSVAAMVAMLAVASGIELTHLLASDRHADLTDVLLRAVAGIASLLLIVLPLRAAFARN